VTSNGNIGGASRRQAPRTESLFAASPGHTQRWVLPVTGSHSCPPRPDAVKCRRVTILIRGCLMLLPGVGLLLRGSGLGVGYAFGREDAGPFHERSRGLQTSTVDPQTSGWLLDALDTDVWLRVIAGGSGRPMFAGIGSAAHV
jgi:hypothetical protein